MNATFPKTLAFSLQFCVAGLFHISSLGTVMAKTSNILTFPFEITPVDKVTDLELLKYFHGEKTGFVQVGPEKYFFPHKYAREAENYYNFQARPSDVWVATFPRSGTTWTQELVWLVANDLNFEAARRIPLTKRFPFFEFHLFMHPDVKQQLLQENTNNATNQEFIRLISTPGYDLLSNVPENETRFIKTHFPFSLLPPSVLEQKCKVIYVTRNPKDVAVSFYHLNRLYRTQGYVGDFERYWKYFQKGLNPWMPYFSHIREAFTYRDNPNILMLQYEDMCANLQGNIKRIANFLEKSLDESKMERLLNHLNIESFKANPALNAQEMKDIGILNHNSNGFVRSGGSESSMTEFRRVPELLQSADEWIRCNERQVLEFTSAK